MALVRDTSSAFVVRGASLVNDIIANWVWAKGRDRRRNGALERGRTRTVVFQTTRRLLERGVPLLPVQQWAPTEDFGSALLLADHLRLFAGVRENTPVSRSWRSRLAGGASDKAAAQAEWARRPAAATSKRD